MNIFTEQPKRRIREFSDAAVRRFLLAQLQSGEQMQFEQALFTDPELAQRVRLAEIDLADDYSFSRLRGFEAAQFEEWFLCSADRAATLSASHALKLRFAGAGRAPHINRLTLESFRAAFLHSPLRFAFAMVLLALLLGTLWLVIKKEPQIKWDLTRRLMPKQAPAQPTPLETHHATNTSEPQHQETPQSLPEHGTPRVFTFSLARNTREAAPVITAASNEYDLIQFELSVKPHSTSRYAVEVLTTQRQSIYAGSAEPESDSTVKFAAARSLFQPGEFEIRLMDENSRAPLASYYFRVE